MPSPTQLDGLGVCTNGECEEARRRQPIECYPGPGQYCPECGELLSPASTLETEVALQPGITLETTAPPDHEGQPDSRLEPQQVPPVDGNAANRRRRLVLVACGAVALIAVAAAAGVTQIIPALGVRVCTSSMTDGIAKEVVDSYSSQHSTWPYYYAVTAPGDLACDVRFFTADAGHEESVIARDGVVAVVNPQNPISQLDEGQVRDIFDGRIVDWSQLGGHPAKITADVPAGDSDEVHTLDDRLMSGRPLGSDVDQTLSAAQIVRLIASPSGAHAIGMVPFSAALPAKVLALSGEPAPSSLSIADEHYPLSLRILAASDFRHPKRPAAQLVSFTRSALARRILLRARLATPRGS